MCDQELKKVSNKIKNIPHDESLGEDQGEDFVRTDQDKKVSQKNYVPNLFNFDHHYDKELTPRKGWQ